MEIYYYYNGNDSLLWSLGYNKNISQEYWYKTENNAVIFIDTNTHIVDVDCANAALKKEIIDEITDVRGRRIKEW